MRRAVVAWPGLARAALCVALIAAGDAIGSADVIPASRPVQGDPSRRRRDRTRPAESGRHFRLDFVLKVGSPGAHGAPSAIAVLRDDAGVAMPLVPQPDAEAFTLVDLTEPPSRRAIRARRIVTLIQREPSAWVAVDYRRSRSRLSRHRNDRLRERRRRRGWQLRSTRSRALWTSAADATRFAPPAIRVAAMEPALARKRCCAPHSAPITG